MLKVTPPEEYKKYMFSANLLITLSVLNCYSPNFQGFILMKNALNNQVGMLGDMFLWLGANLKQGVIYFIKQALPPNKSAGSVPI